MKIPIVLLMLFIMMGIGYSQNPSNNQNYKKYFKLGKMENKKL